MQKSSKVTQGRVLLGGCFLFSTVTFAAHIDTHGKQIELAAVTNQIQQLQKNLHDDQTEQEDLVQELKTLELNLTHLNQEIEHLNQDLVNEQTELAKLKTSEQTLQTKLTDQRQALIQQIRIMYRLGKMHSLKTILNPDDINNIDRHLYYYQTLSEARSKLMAEVKSTLSILNANLAEITQHELNLKNLLQAKQLQQKQTLQAEKQRNDVIATLEQKSQTKQQQLATLMSNQKALQDMLDTLQPQETILVDNLPFNQLRGKLEWPLKGRISTITTNANDPHHGAIIINAEEGTPVHAVSGGKVIFANWLRGFGLLVIINHGNGFMSLYARNHAIFTKVGEKVNPRDVIATIGNSGGYNKPSLYFEIRRNGTPVDATEWCHI
ncbi:MAG: peptidoglycan DD-metalloendopeptidase family protein [Gammaproteobacteria bacterium]|nr:peptidoglycan DD-metalloendopeptidase family protein [Gammaproteobacteria bacterium]